MHQRGYLVPDLRWMKLRELLDMDAQDEDERAVGGSDDAAFTI